MALLTQYQIWELCYFLWRPAHPISIITQINKTQIEILGSKTGSDCWDVCRFYGHALYPVLWRSCTGRPTFLHDEAVVCRCGRPAGGFKRLVVWRIWPLRGVVYRQPRLLCERHRFRNSMPTASRRVASTICRLAKRHGVWCAAG